MAWLYMYAFLLGIALGAVYDVLRITRVFLGVHYSRRAAKKLQEIRLPFLSPHKKQTESHALGFVVFLEDLLFCVLVGVSLILLFYGSNNGKLRFPALICTCAGFLLYRGTVGRLVMLFSEVIAFLIETTVRYSMFFLLFPFRALGKWLKKRIRQAVNHVIGVRRKRMRRRFTASQSARIEQNACGMIPQDIPKKSRIKRGKSLGKGKSKKETVQSHTFDARASRRSGGGIDRNIC